MLAEELAAAGIKSKRRIRPDGTEYGHQRFSHGALYLLLQNRTCRGEATHKGNSYPGEQAAIVDDQLWEAVQAALAKNRVAYTTGARTKQPSLLTGILFDEAGGRLTPTYCVKKGTRYRCEVSTALVTGAAKGRSTRYRIPAGDLESVVLDRLRTLLANPAEILDVIGNGADSRVTQQDLFERGRQIADELGARVPEKIKAIVRALVCRVEIRPNCVQVDVAENNLAALLTAQSDDLPTQDDNPRGSHDDILTLTAVAKLTRLAAE
jgi:hypothetical protein